MKLASYQIDRADNSYVALFILSLFSFVLFSELVMSLSVLVSVLSPLWPALFSSRSNFKACVTTAIQSKIKISKEIKTLLFNGLIANSDQSFHYYKIFSRMVE